MKAYRKRIGKLWKE